MVFAARMLGDELVGLPELVVEGLREADARALLDSVLTGPLDPRVHDRIVAEAGGNPLALVELPRGVTSAELAGGFALPDAMPLSGRIEESFRRRLEPLPDDTLRLLQLAAADPVGDPVLVWRAAERLGIATEAATPTAEAGLVEFGARVRFRHPLVRSAVYRSASLQERQEVHRALAEATDPELDPDRRAWHWAQATPGPDEDVAAELERSAGRAQARGGVAAAAAFLQRSVALTVDRERRAERALAAAQASFQAGAFDAALELVATAEAGALDEFQRARVDLLRGQVAFASGASSEAPRLLLRAARRLEPLRPGPGAPDLPDRMGRGGRRRRPRGRTPPRRDLPRRPGPPPAAWSPASPRPAPRRACPADDRWSRRRDSDVAASSEQRSSTSRWRTSSAGAGWPRRPATPCGTTRACWRSPRDRSSSSATPARLRSCRSTSSAAGHRKRVDRRLRGCRLAHRGDRQRRGGNREPLGPGCRAEAPGPAREGSRGLRS